MLDKLVIFGLSTMAELAYYYFSNDSNYEVMGFVVDSKYKETDSFYGLPVIETDCVKEIYPPSTYQMFIAIGYSNRNRNREIKYNQMKNIGYSFATYIHSSSIIPKACAIGDNCFILENNTIQPFVTIGDNVTIWSNNVIGHGSVIKDHCFIASHVIISGQVSIESKCFIGVNATIQDHIHLKEGCIIGAGALISQDTIQGGVYKGIPSQLSN